MPAKHRIFTTSVAKVYPSYLAKAEKKGRTKSEVDMIICWLTGYSQQQLEQELKKETDFETFFKKAPKPNVLRSSIKGVVCGIRVEEMQDRRCVRSDTSISSSMNWPKVRRWRKSCGPSECTSTNLPTA